MKNAANAAQAQPPKIVTVDLNKLQQLQKKLDETSKELDAFINVLMSIKKVD